MQIIIYFDTGRRDRSRRVGNLQLVFRDCIFISSCSCCSRSILRRTVRRAILTLGSKDVRRGNLKFFIFWVFPTRSAEARRPR